MKTIDDLLVGSPYEGAKGINSAMLEVIDNAKPNAALALQLPKAVEALKQVRAHLGGMNTAFGLKQYAVFGDIAERLDVIVTNTLTTIREAQATVEDGK